MNTKELKLYVPERLKNRIIMLANEKGFTINKMSNYLLEIGLYKLLEEESDYGRPLNKKSKEKQ